MERRAYQKVPYKLDSQEWLSFLNYAKKHYKEAIRIALEIANEPIPPVSFAVNRANLAEILLEKIASPLIYLWEKWQLLSAEEKLPYATPEYRKVLENAIKIGKEAASQLGEAKNEP